MYKVSITSSALFVPTTWPTAHSSPFTYLRTRTHGFIYSSVLSPESSRVTLVAKRAERGCLDCAVPARANRRRRLPTPTPSLLIACHPPGSPPRGKSLRDQNTPASPTSRQTRGVRQYRPHTFHLARVHSSQISLSRLTCDLGELACVRDT